MSSRVDHKQPPQSFPARKLPLSKFTSPGTMIGAWAAFSPPEKRPPDDFSIPNKNMSNLLKKFPGTISGEDALDRGCSGIPPEACQERPYNFAANVANGSASKLAEQIAGPNLILPWLFQLLGAPVWMLGFLMPVKQTFSLLPQMAVAGQIRKLSLRKWVWVTAGIVQALCLVLMVVVAFFASPVVAGYLLLLLLVVFSSASGTASVAFQDVLGKTIGKGMRGSLLGRRALIGGILTTIAGFMVSRVRGAQEGLLPVLSLMLLAAGLWLLASFFFALIREVPGAVKGGRNILAESRAGWSLYRNQPGFRKFLGARGALLSIELAPPFFVLHAGQILQLKTAQVGSIVVAIGISQIVSSPLWGRLADRTSRKVMALSALIGLAGTLLALMLPLFANQVVLQGGYLIVFVLIGLAEAGVRLGRKTYLVDATPQDDRPTYTAFSNISIGILALLSGATGLIAQKLGPASMLVFIAAVMLSGYFACLRMPEAADMLENN